MCGIFSIYPTRRMNRYSAKRLLMALALLNDQRGGDSFGLFGHGLEPVRGLGNMAGAKPFDAFLNGWGNNMSPQDWIVGHTRLATHGTVTIANAHPFEAGPYTVVHNGIVDVDGYDAKHHVVDSCRIALAMRDFGPVEALSRVSGSAGLLWSDNGKLRAYRSGQSLYMATGRWGWVLSSDRSHLCSALGFASLSGNIKEVPTDKIIAPWYGEAMIDAPTQEDVWGGTTPGKWWQKGEEKNDYHSRYEFGRGRSIPVLHSIEKDDQLLVDDNGERPGEYGIEVRCAGCHADGDFGYNDEFECWLCDDCEFAFDGSKSFFN